MPIRRSADPINVQHVWDAIRCTASQRQMADPKRIVKYLQKIEKCTQNQAELYVKQTASDGLIVALQKNTAKGEEVSSYRIPTTNLPEMDGKDWYCFECHLAGNVNCCQKCHRVFHTDCIPNARRKFGTYKRYNLPSGLIHNQSIEDYENNDSNTSSRRNSFNNNEHDYDITICCICNIATINHDLNLDRNEMNYLLKFVLHRIQSWLPNAVTHMTEQEKRPDWLTDTELTWRANQFFYVHRDMSVIEVNLNNEYYEHVCEFLADVLTIQHNVAIFHGMKSQEYRSAKFMVQDCLHDLSELKNCVDCYRHSNEKINTKWFCLPCRNPHKLVWAKQKGYPYWPAKVIRETERHFDVRFFGGKYERAILPKSAIKPVTIPKEDFYVKGTAAFNKSVEELVYHQRLLTDSNELNNMLNSANNRKIAKKRKNPPLRPINNEQTSNNNLQEDEENLLLPEKRTRTVSIEAVEDETPIAKESVLINGNALVTVPATTATDQVIHISDAEEEKEEKYHVKDNCFIPSLECDGAQEQVSSSTENHNAHVASQNIEMQQLDHPYCDAVERMRRKIESITDKKDIIKCAMDSMQIEIDRITNDHNDHLKRLFEMHNAQISETKKKQWCYNCEQDAIYHCCWNTAYCSQICQQQHWQAEHKKVCRRKR